MKKYHLFWFLTIFSIHAYPQHKPAYKNPSLTIDERVADLLKRMTVEEKFWQLFMIPISEESIDMGKYKNGIFGFQVSAGSKEHAVTQQVLDYGVNEEGLALVRRINDIQRNFVEHTRLGIPIIAFDEALHGLVRDGATAFPQAIGLAATFDTTMMRLVATAIAREAAARGIRQVLSPVINIAGDPRWGRVEETYGEDPFLTTAMAVAFVTTLEKQNIITTPKHFIANVGDGGRDSYPIHFNKRLLEEIHFPPFKACFGVGRSRSVMTSYNSVDGTASTMNDWLLNKKLKQNWDFRGFVISDAGAAGGANVLHMTSPDYPTSTQKSINNGLDVIFQTNYEHHKLFMPPFLDGRISMERIDDAVSRVLRAKFELGLFEEPYVDEGRVMELMNQKSHKSIALQAALESIVLLKNKNNVLPLSKDIRSIAVIGADAEESRLGGYSGPGNGKVSILDGIKKCAGKGTLISFQPGGGRTIEELVTVPAVYLSNGKGHEGLDGAYFENIDLSGKPVLTRVDRNIDFHWTLFPPGSTLSDNFYSIRWTGKIHFPESGVFRIGLQGNDGFRLYLNDSLLIDNWRKQTYSSISNEFHFEKNREYDIRIEFFEPIGNAHIKLVWNIGATNDQPDKIQKAVALAQSADLTVIVAGIEEGEFRDRALLNLPGSQERQIKQVAATGKPVVVVLVGGSAITMNNWIDHVDGILDVWYPGEEGGHAVASVLFGDYNPAGRLPITFPMHEGQLPLVYNHKPTGRGDDYINLSGLPLFPFGYGLSYTNFEYDGLKFDRNNILKTDSTVVRFRIKNVGTKNGDEVVQLYIRDMLSSVAQPVMQLKGFQRTHLAPGESKEIIFTITPQMLSMLNENMLSVVEPGEFRIMIGASSRDIRLIDILNVMD